jgi:hypothetical protein
MAAEYKQLVIIKKIVGFEPDLNLNCYLVQLDDISKNRQYRLFWPVGYKVGDSLEIDHERLNNYTDNLLYWFHLPLDT